MATLFMSPLRRRMFGQMLDDPRLREEDPNAMAAVQPSTPLRRRVLEMPPPSEPEPRPTLYREGEQLEAPEMEAENAPGYDPGLLAAITGAKAMGRPKHPYRMQADQAYERAQQMEEAPRPKTPLWQKIIGGLMFGLGGGMPAYNRITGESGRREEIARQREQGAFWDWRRQRDLAEQKAEMEQEHEGALRPLHRRLLEAQVGQAERGPLDEKADEYVNEQGQRVLVFRKADGTTYEQTLGKVRPLASETQISDFERMFQREFGRLPNASEKIDYERTLAASQRDPDAGTRGVFISLTDEEGRVIGAWNPKTGEKADVPPELAAQGARRGGLSDSAKARRGMLSNLVEDLDVAGKLAEQYRNTGVIGGGYLGPFSARVQSWARSMGVPGSEEDAIRLERILNNAADILLRARSGAQINEQEYQRLTKLIPKLTESEVSFFTKLKDFTNEVKRLQAKTTGEQSTTRPPVQKGRVDLNEPSTGKVAMIAPDGTPMMIPADKVAEAERRGAKRAPTQ